MKSSIYNSLSKDTTAVAESLMAMMQKERTIYTSCDYLNPPTLLEVDDSLITEADRLKIVDWCFSVNDACNFDRETVAIAMEMVDRFLSKPSHISYDALRDRTKFQLLAMAALNIAIKTSESVVIGYDFLSAVSQGMYSVEEIEVMEMYLLEGLSWRVCATTSIQTAHYIVSLLLPHVNIQESTLEFILDEVRYQTEHAVRDYHMSMKRPSTLAIAAIFNSVEQLDQQDRQDILRALILVLNVMEEDFDSPEDLLSAKTELEFLVEGHDDSDEDTIMTETTREVEACIWDTEESECFEEKNLSADCPRASPRVSPRRVSFWY